MDAENAGRLIALGGISNVISSANNQRLVEISGEHATGDLIPGRIVAPALRVRDDFRDHTQVMVQSAPSAQWIARDLFAVEQGGPAEESVVTTMNFGDFPLNVLPYDRLRIGIHPKSPRLFTVDDYRTLQKPESGHRERGVAEALRRAIMLSHFDAEIEERTPHQVLRHFTLLLPGLYPRR